MDSFTCFRTLLLSVVERIWHCLTNVYPLFPLHLFIYFFNQLNKAEQKNILASIDSLPIEGFAFGCTIVRLHGSQNSGYICMTVSCIPRSNISSKKALMVVESHRNEISNPQ
jgi:hypothetical protein